MDAIHQMLAGMAFGDAIGNDARVIRDALRSWGYQSEMFAGHVDAQSAGEAHLYGEYKGFDGASSGLILHHSIGGPVTQTALRARAKRMMVYHNITPAEFFEGYSPEMAALTEEGRASLRTMRGQFAMSIADSAYNACELIEMGYANVRVFPILIPFEYLDQPACERTLSRLEGGAKNILFVGRIAPNKKQDDLITAFAYYQRIRPNSRLILAGHYLPTERYYQALLQHIRNTGASNVILTGKVNQAELNACYQRADLFVSMSEHEGFGVPLMEAMHFGIPVLAYKATAVPETMDGAGVLFTEKHYPEIAEMMDMLIEDKGLRERVIAGQRGRVTAFLPERVLPRLRDIVSEFASL